jgi:transcriptional antiterminator
VSLEGYKIKKILNNNVVLATQHNDEKILFSKGIGFTNNIGDIVPNGTKIEKVFSIEDKDNSTKFNKLVSTVDNEIIGISEEIIYMVGKELNEELDEKIHIALADHIAFTLNRLTKNDEIFNPFLVETETLYKKEFEIAKKATSLLEKRTKIEIPEGGDRLHCTSYTFS